MGSQLSWIKSGVIWSCFLAPVISLAEAFRVALSGANLDLGSPARVTNPYSTREITNDWTADWRSSGGRKGLIFLRVLSWWLALLTLALMWPCMFRNLSRVTPKEHAESTICGVQLSVEICLIQFCLSTYWICRAHGLVSGALWGVYSGLSGWSTDSPLRCFHTCWKRHGNAILVLSYHLRVWCYGLDHPMGNLVLLKALAYQQHASLPYVVPYWGIWGMLFNVCVSRIQTNLLSLFKHTMTAYTIAIVFLFPNQDVCFVTWQHTIKAAVP